MATERPFVEIASVGDISFRPPRAPSGRPLPRRTRINAGFFESLDEQAMRLQRCDGCGTFRYYPTPICPSCESFEFEWAPVSGRAVVHSFTWIHRPAPGFEDLAPYVYAVVELEEGPMMTTNIVEVSEDELVIGLAVEVTYEQVAEDATLALFRPRRG